MTKRSQAISKINPHVIARIDSAYQYLNLQADTVLEKVIEKKQKKRHLYANEINQLCTNFGAQLSYDRIFNAMLHTGNSSRQKLSAAQRYAGVRLLQAAAEYDRSYQANTIVRRTLNRGDKGNKIPRHILQKSRKFLYSPKIRRKLFSHRNHAKPDSIDSLMLKLPGANVMKGAFCRIYRKNDRVNALFYNVLPYIGKSLFGNVGNRIKDRKKQRKYATQLLSELQPYDILLSKTPGSMMAKVIPGYFGHAAIWIDQEGKPPKKRILRNLIRKSHTRFEIRQKGMAEALRNGVQLSSLEEYADGEVYLILRIPSLSAELKQKVIENIAKQLEKDYDFNFDIESPDMINCTELVYLVYDFIDWKVRYFMGRYTLFPDDLLLTALDNKQFEIIALLKDGELTLHPGEASMRLLLK